jgi:hypothetical protein
MFSLVFVLFVIAFVVIFVMVIGGMVFQLFTVGSIFAVVTQRMKQQVEQSAPKPCGFCGSTIPAGETKCPGCGGPRDGTQPSA